MDPSTVLLLLSLRPAHMDSNAVELRGAFGPIIIPLDGLTPDTKAEWLWHAHTLPPGLRVAALMAAGRTHDAFELIGGLHQGIMGDIAEPLKAWTKAEGERLGIITDNTRIAPLPGTRQPRLHDEALAALTTVSESLPLMWPRWVGPLIVMDADANPDPIPGLSWLARPALPVLRCPTAERGAIAADLVRMTLALADPPERGWPVWLRLGLSENIRQRAQGHPVSPRLMRQCRQAAGVDGIRTLLAAKDPDMPLAIAVCAPFLLTEHRFRFPELLAVLRNNVSSEEALHFAYGWSLADVVAIR